VTQIVPISFSVIGRSSLGDSRAEAPRRRVCSRSGSRRAARLFLSSFPASQRLRADSPFFTAQFSFSRRAAEAQSMLLAYLAQRRSVLLFVLPCVSASPRERSVLHFPPTVTSTMLMVSLPKMSPVFVLAQRRRGAEVFVSFLSMSQRLRASPTPYSSRPLTALTMPSFINAAPKLKM